MPYIETDCTIEHDGQTFTAGGAIVTKDRAVAYCASEQMPEPITLNSGSVFYPRHSVGTESWRGTLTDWHGNPIGTYSVKSQRRTQWGTTFYISARINYRDYHGQTQGPGMIAYLKAYKHQEREWCRQCAGTGEQFPCVTCRKCEGTGTVRKEENRDTA